MRHLLRFTILALTATLVMPTMTAAQEASPPGEARVLKVGSEVDIISANPFRADGIADYEMMLLTYDMLFSFDSENLMPTDGLGIWPPSLGDDGRTWTIKIRDDAKWSDGEPVTSRDIAFTYNFVQNNHAARSLDNPVPEGSTFETPDDTTLIWKLPAPGPIGPTTPPYIPILPEHIWGRFDGKADAVIEGYRNVPAVGSGPFTLTEWKEGEYWKVEANPYYWGEDAYLDEVFFRTYGEMESLKLALIKGEIDIAAGFSPNVFNQIKGEPDIETLAATPLLFDSLSFNFEGSANPALHDERVRDAIHHAIDKQAIVDRVWLGGASPGDTYLVPAYSRWYKPINGTSEEVEYDPLAAAELLKEAGYTDSDGDGVVEKNGQPLKLEITAISDWSKSRDESEMIKGFLERIGIDVSMQTVSEARGNELWRAQDFDMYVWYWDPDVDPQFMTKIFTTDECLSWSDGCYSDPYFDKLAEKIDTETDEAKRQELVGEAQSYIYDKAPIINLVYPGDLLAWRTDRFEGWTNIPSPNGPPIFSWNPATYLALRPVEAPGDGSTAGGTFPWVWVVLGAGVILGGVVIVIVRRPRGVGADKE